MKLTKNDYFKIIPIILVIFFIFLTWSLNQRKVNIELIQLNNNLETYKNLLLEIDQEQQELINQLQSNLKDHNNRIDVNFKNMNNLTSELINLKIEQDELSEQSILYLFDEVWEELDRLKKAVK